MSVVALKWLSPGTQINTMAGFLGISWVLHVVAIATLPVVVLRPIKGDGKWSGRRTMLTRALLLAQGLLGQHSPFFALSLPVGLSVALVPSGLVVLDPPIAGLSLLNISFRATLVWLSPFVPGSPS